MLKTFPNTSTTDKTGILRKIPQKIKRSIRKIFQKQKKSSANRNSLDMTANHKTYDGMNLSFLRRNLIKHEIWDSVSFKNRKCPGAQLSWESNRLLTGLSLVQVHLFPFWFANCKTLRENMCHWFDSNHFSNEKCRPVGRAM